MNMTTPSHTGGEMTPRQCGHCGCWHGLLCPFVKAVEYYPDGTVKRIEYMTTPASPPVPQPIPPLTWGPNTCLSGVATPDVGIWS